MPTGVGKAGATGAWLHAMSLSRFAVGGNRRRLASGIRFFLTPLDGKCLYNGAVEIAQPCVGGWQKEGLVAKADKQLKKLGRADLLELLVEHSKEIERLRTELEAAGRVQAELEATRRTCAELRQRNAQLEQGCAGLDSVSDEAVRRVMSGASRAVEEIVSKNQLQADAILEDAREEAAKIIADANDEAAVIRKYAKMLMADARAEAARMETAARGASDKQLAETRRICSDLLSQAQAEINALFDDADARVTGGLL